MQLRLRKELYKLVSNNLLISPSIRRKLVSEYLKTEITDSDIPSYKDRSLKVKSEELSSFNLTCNYDTSEGDSIAFYFIEGFISYDSWYWSCTKQLIQDLIAADKNSAINAHFILINSGGGEAHGLDDLAETIRNLSKPIVSVCESIMCSAAYYSACSSTKIFASNKFDTIGSIGTMVTVYDDRKWMEQIGLNELEFYATKSTHKNKKINDALDGNAEQLIEEVLNPIQEQFELDVKQSRPLTLNYPEANIYAGETFFATKALEIGLIDGICSLEDAYNECVALAEVYKNKNSIQNNIINNF